MDLELGVSAEIAKTKYYPQIIQSIGLDKLWINFGLGTRLSVSRKYDNNMNWAINDMYEKLATMNYGNGDNGDNGEDDLEAQRL